jgi:hypothetical protein
MAADKKFTGDIRLEVKWNRAAPEPELERELRVLFARYGL